MGKLPLLIEQEIMVKSLQAEKSPHRARSIIVGAKHGEFIIIDEPIVRISDNIVSIVDGPVHCWYIHDGIKYSFDTLILKKLDDGLTFLEYPKRFDVERLRKFLRVKVNLEARFRLNNAREYNEGTILDISQKGCFLRSKHLLVVPEKSKIVLTFKLPDDQLIKDIEGVVRHIAYKRVKGSTEMGIEFIGPDSELKKLAKFCYLCQFFKV